MSGKARDVTTPHHIVKIFFMTCPFFTDKFCLASVFVVALNSTLLRGGKVPVS
jgi:hypothetical protein